VSESSEKTTRRRVQNAAAVPKERATLSIFARFRDIVETSIDSLVEGSDNPARTLRLMIQEMEDALVEMKSSCAQEMASRAKAQRSLETLAGEEKRWMERAELAVARGRDDMAREALLRRRTVLASLETARTLLSEIAQKIRKSQEEIARVEGKLREARAKLAARQETPSAPAPAPSVAASADEEIEKLLSEIRTRLGNNNLTR
jgi:phage shock protein A